MPFTAYALPGVPLPGRAWRMVYESRTATGSAVRVSGTVMVPRTPWRGPGPRPLLGLAPGTQGLADRCAASHQWAVGTEYESVVAAQALMRGWAVAATDYQGLGTPGDHTYVVGRALGHDLIDAMRAAHNLTAAGLSRRAPAAVYGFSEGGGAAAWALQVQPTYAPGLRLVAGAVGGTATDFLQLMHHVENSPLAFLQLYAAIGFDAAYPELHLARYLTPRGVAAVRTLRNSCIEDAIVDGLLMPTSTATYVRPDPLVSSAWLRRLHQNDLGRRAPQVPVLIGGSDLDEVFPFAQESELYDRWCARGVDAHLLRLHTPEHVITGAAFSGPGLRFIADRLAGVTLSRASSCRRR
ncbi:lipase family protein [Nocardioides ultimimeridianus]